MLDKKHMHYLYEVNKNETYMKGVQLLPFFHKLGLYNFILYCIVHEVGFNILLFLLKMLVSWVSGFQFWVLFLENRQC